MITEQMLPAMQGIIPSAFCTADDDGVPNISYLSQVYYVDPAHVAISNQFLNKSMRNILANGRATVVVIDPITLRRYRLYMQHQETRTSGELFDNMAMQLEAIASMYGMQDVFRLQAAEVFKVFDIAEVAGGE